MEIFITRKRVSLTGPSGTQTTQYSIYIAGSRTRYATPELFKLRPAREIHTSIYMSDREGFIQTSGDCFDGKGRNKGGECYKAIFSCPTCASMAINAWERFCHF